MWKNGCKNGAHEPVHDQVGALLPRSLVQRLVIHRTNVYPPAQRPLQLRMLSLGIDRTRTLRGAVCGAVAADGLGAPAAARQARVRLALRRRRAARQGGRHAASRLVPDRARHAHPERRRCSAPSTPTSRRRCRSPAALRGPAAALVEHLAAWPLGAVSDRIHPARDELPDAARATAARSRRSLWRHLLFGLVLGELERRLNAEPEPAPPDPRRPTTRATATASSSTPSASAPTTTPTVRPSER